MGARLGFGSGWRPLVFFRWSFGWTPPILNKWTCLDQAGAGFGLGLARGFLNNNRNNKNNSNSNNISNSSNYSNNNNSNSNKDSNNNNGASAGGRQALNHSGLFFYQAECNVWIWVWLGASHFLQINPGIIWTCPDEAGAGFGSGLP